MLLYLNERLFTPRQSLRAVLLAPEAGRTSVLGPGENLQARFRLRDAGEGLLDLEPARINRDLVLQLPYPWHAGEFRLANVKPGRYQLEAVVGARVVVNEGSVVVIGEQQATAFNAAIAAEGIRDTRKFDTIDSFRDAWQEAWQDVFEYLRVPMPTYFGTSFVTLTSVPPLLVHAFRWAMFHINLVIFDMAIYGVGADFAQVEGTPMQFRYVVRPRLQVEDGRLDDQLKKLTTLFVDPNFSLTVTRAAVPQGLQPPPNSQLPPPVALLMTWK